jgi:hypothetical protein|tara:strand:- start:56 stop:307 length:252 start_codon:yes stop_codon:yes gene_type:complete
MNVTSTISSAQKKALETDVEDITAWFDNWLQHRANTLLEQVFQDEVKRLIENGETISGTKDEIVLASPVLSAVERSALKTPPP